MNNEMVDLASFGAGPTDGSFMEVCNPATGEPLLTNEGDAVGITLLGRDGSAYRKTQRAITDRRLSKKGSSNLTAERLESEANEILAKCTVSWVGMVYNGDPLECNYRNAKMLYDELPWLKEQVDEFVAERSNFLES